MAPNLSKEELIEGGFVPGRPSGSWMGNWDKIEGRMPSENQPDDIMEDASGIHARYQPHVIFLTEPRLFGPYNMWRCGVREIGFKEYQELSRFEREAIIVLSNADHRRSRSGN